MIQSKVLRYRPSPLKLVICGHRRGWAVLRRPSRSIFRFYLEHVSPVRDSHRPRECYRARSSARRQPLFAFSRPPWRPENSICSGGEISLASPEADPRRSSPRPGGHLEWRGPLDGERALVVKSRPSTSFSSTTAEPCPPPLLPALAMTRGAYSNSKPQTSAFLSPAWNRFASETPSYPSGEATDISAGRIGRINTINAPATTPHTSKQPAADRAEKP